MARATEHRFHVSGFEQYTQVLYQINVVDYLTARFLEETNYSKEHTDKVEAVRNWKKGVQHHWYRKDMSSPNTSVSLASSLSRELQTAIARLKTGHTYKMRFVGEDKTYPLCPDCNAEANPEHIFLCLGHTLEDLYKYNNLWLVAITLKERKCLMDVV